MGPKTKTTGRRGTKSATVPPSKDEGTPQVSLGDVVLEAATMEDFELPEDFVPLVEAPPTQSKLRHRPEIKIRNARTHNLQGLDLTIPHGRLTVITGPSGSGKSSLAFDTLYAEGQRRYVESLSTYARQFLDRMQRPDVDSISGLQPAIAIEQKNTVRNARSTIGTATEISDYMRLLWARAGQVICQTCQTPVRADSPESVVDALMEQRAGVRLYMVAPAPRTSGLANAAFGQELRRAGFSRVLAVQPRAGAEVQDPESDPSAGSVGKKTAPAKKSAKATAPKAPANPSPKPQSLADLTHEILHLEDDAGDPRLDKALEGWDGSVRVVVDRVVPDTADRERLDSAVSLAFQAGAGTVEVWDADYGHPPLVYRSGLRCNGCGTEYPWPEPNHFSFNSPIGACKTCSGFGRIAGPDWDLVLPNPSLTLSQSAVAPFNSPSYHSNYRPFRQAMEKEDVPLNVPVGLLTPEQLRSVHHWLKKHFFEELEAERYKMQSRIMVARYRGFTPCTSCDGSRLGPLAQRVVWAPADGSMPPRRIDQAWAMTVSDLLADFRKFRPTDHETQLLERLLEEILARLEYMERVGLGYLSLDRQTRSLSGGEAQRINLAAALGTALTRTLYVLDEPTVGLHPRDTRRLISILKDLRNLGNTIVVVEHDPEVILGADHVIDLGPHAGSRGGRLMSAGAPEQLLAQGAQGRTATALIHWAPLMEAAYGTPSRSKARRSVDGSGPAILPFKGPAIRVRGAWMHSLRGLDADIPLRSLVAITGVSGSGKSTLVHRVISDNFRRARGLAAEHPAAITSLEGFEAIVELLVVDQSPVARSIRSNPVTYVKGWDAIRKVMANTPEARVLRLTESSFSFNAGDGRCEVCEGSGVITYDMHFLAEMTLPCEACEGRRFTKRVLQVQYNGKSVHDILQMTVDDAVEFFSGTQAVLRRLRPLQDVGLGYITLGQSTATMSGGEAQRLKLAGYLALNPEAGPSTVIVFDEPTTGLSLSDVEVLVGVFRRLVSEGFSVIVVEHNLEVIRQSDWVIDLGPEAGAGGGKIVASGPPAHVATVGAAQGSHTGKFLAEVMVPLAPAKGSKA